MTQETFEQMVERIGIELNGGYQPSPIELRATVEFAIRLLDELAKVAAPAGVPDGWKMVPVEATGEMLGVLTNVAARCNSWKDGYKAMLSAAPSAPADAVVKDAEAEYAIKESRRINSCEEYFGARPQIDCLDRRRVFEAGFDRGYDAAMQGKESGNV